MGKHDQSIETRRHLLPGRCRRFVLGFLPVLILASCVVGLAAQSFKSMSILFPSFSRVTSNPEDWGRRNRSGIPNLDLSVSGGEATGAAASRSFGFEPTCVGLTLGGVMKILYGPGWS